MRIDRRSLPPDAARLLMDVFAMAGQERRAARVARAALGQHLRGGIDGGSLKVWEAVYPIPFRDVVEKHAAKAKVDPDLVQALMREESRFNVRARSATGALGLTQLMPQTARNVAAALKMRGVSEAALFRPEVNIKLGATYLGMLLADLNGSVPHAVAAYNAGPHAVRRWLRVRGGVELDAWVEEIPFAETRDYVKRVLASYAAYQLVYRGQTSVALGGPRPPAAASQTGTTLSSGARAR
jgi:soluble lytic murein transglycosylase